MGPTGDVLQLIKGNPGQTWPSRIAVGTGMAKYSAPAKKKVSTSSNPFKPTSNLFKPTAAKKIKF
jgi:hypothetical protein